MARSMVGLVLVLLALGCDSAVQPDASDQPVQKAPSPTDTATAGLAKHIALTGDTSLAYIDRELSFTVTATDEHGHVVDSDLAEISASELSIAQLQRRLPFSGLSYPGGPTVRGVQADFGLVAVGTTTIRARLGDLTDSITLVVHPFPPPTQALVVDSFYVVESSDCPPGGCSYEYWPVMRLHEPTGANQANLVAVYFSVPTLNTRLCRGSLLFGPGSFQYVDSKRENYYGSDLLMGSGRPAPDGAAVARLIVSDVQGHLGSIEVTGPILRGADAPSIPTVDSNILSWLCW